MSLVMGGLGSATAEVSIAGSVAIAYPCCGLLTHIVVYEVRSLDEILFYSNMGISKIGLYAISTTINTVIGIILLIL